MASCCGGFLIMPVNEMTQWLDNKSPSTARVSSLVATVTKCAPAFIWTGMEWEEERTSRSFLWSCAVSMTHFSAGHSDRRSPSCCWIRITWNTWSTPSDLIRTAHHSSDQEEKQTSPVGVPCFVPLLSWIIMHMCATTQCFWRSLWIRLICSGSVLLSWWAIERMVFELNRAQSTDWVRLSSIEFKSQEKSNNFSLILITNPITLIELIQQNRIYPIGSCAIQFIYLTKLNKSFYWEFAFRNY